MTTKAVIAPPSAQESLFWQPPVYNCVNTASARVAYGNAAQQVAYRLLGITPVQTSGAYETCFDGWKDGRYYEIKSTRISGGKIVMYDWRIEKDAASGQPLDYVIVCHSLDRARDDILGAMTSRAVSLYQIPAAVIHAFALACPLSMLSSKAQDYAGDREGRNGFTRGGYSRGYRNLPLKALVAGCQWRTERVENTLGAGRVTMRTFVSLKKGGA